MSENEQTSSRRSEEAFASHGGAQAVPYDDPIGLTSAFAPIGTPDDPDGGEFSQNEERSRPARHARRAACGDEGASDNEDVQPSDAEAPDRPLAYEGDVQEDFRDPVEALEPVAAAPLLVGDDGLADRFSEEDRKGARRGKAADLPAPARKSRRIRRRLIVIIVLLIVLLGGFGYLGYTLFKDTQNGAAELSALRASVTVAATGEDVSKPSVQKTTEVPRLPAVIGLEKSEAIEKIGHGATEVKSSEAADADSVIKTNVTCSLTSEPADPKTGVPSVYLGLDEDGKVVQAGYSASPTALGFGDLSFSDLVVNGHAIEGALREAGLKVQDGAALLPADASEYTTYAANQTTVQKQQYAFEGTADSYAWSAVLSYDYSAANLSGGNVSDTVRVLYLYIEKA
ncbi:histone-lysine N-methyltransferase [Gordonibacter sp. Marseille-P4307]|uniref:histone-lysine N-methyltransferase n=1 Tax=Gordonibacter sp. Marseille-P4307 TaxID=2161815 RepID=UPI000F524E18|nr:histone-lysine N-methyltransferase [Gordonibacter sp. Marseille-P4307]